MGEPAASRFLRGNQSPQHCREMSGNLPSNDFPSGDELRPKVDPVTGIDLSLIEENLKLTPWERRQANDDALNFGNMLREPVIRSSGVRPGIHVLPCGEREHGRPAGAGQRSS